MEDWIEQDASLVNSSLIIVGRQVNVDAGRIDLLALDYLGNYWAIIEIKRGIVSRATIAQALDYFACVNALSPSELQKKVETYLAKNNKSLAELLHHYQLDESIFEQDSREITIYVVGTCQDDSLNRIATVLDLNSNFTISVVTFDTFEDDSGNWILARQLDDLEDNISPTNLSSPTHKEVASPVQHPDHHRNAKFQSVRELAYQNGVGEAFDTIYAVATTLQRILQERHLCPTFRQTTLSNLYSRCQKAK